jgi:methylenetetrahydrofolate--tRNA-(uracil-5-)-methyltransferase
MNAAKRVRGLEPVSLPEETVFGALMSYVTYEGKETLQPMHVSFGLLPRADAKGGKKQKRLAQAERSLRVLRAFLKEHDSGPSSRGCEEEST